MQQVDLEEAEVNRGYDRLNYSLRLRAEAARRTRNCPTQEGAAFSYPALSCTADLVLNELATDTPDFCFAANVAGTMPKTLALDRQPASLTRSNSSLDGEEPVLHRKANSSREKHFRGVEAGASGRDDFAFGKRATTCGRQYGSTGSMDQLQESCSGLDLRDAAPCRLRNMSVSSSTPPPLEKNSNSRSSGKSEGGGGNFTFLKKLRGSSKSISSGCGSKEETNSAVIASKDEESAHLALIRARRSIAHFDSQSVSWSVASLVNTSACGGLGQAQRRNTGASAAANVATRNSCDVASLSSSNASGAGAGAAAQHLPQIDLLRGRESFLHNCVQEEEQDCGDGRSNHLLSSCPFFRNELGGENVRIAALTRITGARDRRRASTFQPVDLFHRPPSCNSTSLLEPLQLLEPLSTLSKNAASPPPILEQVANGGGHAATCLVTNKGQAPWSTYLLEYVDHGASFYRKCFYGYEHQNWFGVDEELGPLAVSLRREKLSESDVLALMQQQQLAAAATSKVGSSGCSGGGSSSVAQPLMNGAKDDTHVNANAKAQHLSPYIWRVIIRTRHLCTLRGSVLEDAVPCSVRYSVSRGVPAREVLHFVAPELSLGCLRLGTTEPQTSNLLIKLDEQSVMKFYKVGVLLCKAGQSSEEEMYNNEHISPALEEFMELIGTKVTLQNFPHYKGGLDIKSDTTGMYSYYTRYAEDCEVMFHISSLLPFTANNRQQLMRKRHIGNDIVTIVFQEAGSLPFSPKTIRSQFQHIFVVIRVYNCCTDKTSYSIAVSRSCDVPTFGPPLPPNVRYPKSAAFVNLLLTKIINGENAAHRSHKFKQMQMRTREDYLRDLAVNHISSSVTLDSKGSSKFFLGSGRKKDRVRLRPVAAALRVLRGALTWAVSLTDFTAGRDVSSQLAIGWDNLVFVEDGSKMVICTLPCNAIIGWRKLSNGFGLRLYYHNGEYVQFTCASDEDRLEMIQRFVYTTPGCETSEIMMDRAQAVKANLSFSVPGGMIVRSVHPIARFQLREASRVVELSRIPTCTLSEDEVYNILRNSKVLHMVLIAPDRNGRTRKCVDIPDVFFSSHNYVAQFGGAGGSSATEASASTQLDMASQLRLLIDPPQSSSDDMMADCATVTKMIAPLQRKFDSDDSLYRTSALLHDRRGAHIAEHTTSTTEEDWLRLVHNATLSMNLAATDSMTKSDVLNNTMLLPLVPKASSELEERCQDLERRLFTSENALAMEKFARQQLEEQVQRLLEQNTKATAQLARFSELIFDNSNNKWQLQ